MLFESKMSFAKSFAYVSMFSYFSIAEPTFHIEGLAYFRFHIKSVDYRTIYF